MSLFKFGYIGMVPEIEGISAVNAYYLLFFCTQLTLGLF